MASNLLLPGPRRSCRVLCSCHRVVELVDAGLKVHFELSTIIGRYVEGFYLQSLHLQSAGLHDAPAVHDPEHAR